MKRFCWLFFGLLLTSCSITGSANTPQPSATPNRTIVGVPSGESNKRLEMDTFKIAITTPSATPQPSSPGVPQGQCPSDTGTPTDGSCYCSGGDQGLYCTGGVCTSGACQQYGIVCENRADGHYCVAKPVIYLYPVKDTLVDVNVTVPGKIVVSDPFYGNGWFGVLAHPNGSLEYRSKAYKELYYESGVDTVRKPTSGIILETKQLKPMLTLITSQLGLMPSEQQEFLDYWVPKLEAVNSPYILFSIIDPIEKDRIDHVSISPKPDTWIEFLAYFKPLAAPTQITPLSLPSSIPTRSGFTAVEWGGTIDNGSNMENTLLEWLVR